MGTVAASRRSRTLILCVVVASSIVSFTMLGWVAPAANQAFRVSVAGRPVMKGANELTLGELGHLLEPGAYEPTALIAPRESIRGLALNYQTRWAMACAPFVLSVFALALTSRRQRRRSMLGLAGCATIFSYYVILLAAREIGLDLTVPAFAAAWALNTAFLILSAAVSMGSRRLSRSPTGGSREVEPSSSSPASRRPPRY